MMMISVFPGKYFDTNGLSQAIKSKEGLATSGKPESSGLKGLMYQQGGSPGSVLTLIFLLGSEAVSLSATS